MMSVTFLDMVSRSLIERASLKCNFSHKKIQSSKFVQLMESRALGELGVVKHLASHFLRSLPIFKQWNLLTSVVHKSFLYLISPESVFCKWMADNINFHISVSQSLRPLVQSSGLTRVQFGICVNICPKHLCGPHWRFKTHNWALLKVQNVFAERRKGGLVASWNA